MTWLNTLRTQILGVTQTELAREIQTTQPSVSRIEDGLANLPRDPFLNLQDFVLKKTGTALPPVWFFQSPSSDQVLSHFDKIEDAAPPVTGKVAGDFPKAGAAS